MWSLEKFKQDSYGISMVITHPTEYAQFEDVFMKTLEANVNIVGTNHKPHVNKELRKAIMERTRLKKYCQRN